MVKRLSKAESEKVTERYLSKQIKAIGGHCYKWVSPGQRGVPDRICCVPPGVTLFVEIKSENEALNHHQIEVITELRTIGSTVYVINTKAQIDDLIRIIKHFQQEEAECI